MHPINSAMDSMDGEMVKRLKYTKEVMTHKIQNKVDYFDI